MRLLHEYVVVEPFRFSGRQYERGQEFPWKKRSIGEFSVRKLEKAGLIEPKSEMKKVFVFDPEIHELGFSSKGSPVILQDGEILRSVTRAQAKEIEEAEGPVELD